MSDLVVVGSLVTDLVFYTEVFPLTGETVIGTFEKGLGGKGFNQVVASCLSGGLKTATFIGSCGNDSESKMFIQQFLDLQINYFLEVGEQSTGAASITVNPEGDNYIVVALGANRSLSADFVKNSFSKLESKPKVVLAQLETNLNSVEASFKLAKQHNTTTILNPAPATFISDNVFNLTDIFTPNETELAHYSKVDLSDIHGDPKGADRLLLACHNVAQKYSIKHLVVTLGQSGVAHFDCSQKKMVGYYPALKVVAVDTTGAGDAFNGAFAAGLIKFNGAIPKAIKMGIITASLSVTKKGTSMSLPFHTQVLCNLNQV